MKEVIIKNWSLILLITLLSCKNHQDNTVVLEIEILREDSIFTENYYGDLISFQDNRAICGFYQKAVTIINLSESTTEKIEKVGEGPGEFKFPRCALFFQDNFIIFCSTLTKIIIYDSSFNYIREHRIPAKISNLFIIDDSTVLYSDLLSNDQLFVIYDLKNSIKLNSFGQTISYPVERYRNHLYNQGILKPIGGNVAVYKNLLFWYDYFHDKFKIFNIFTGDLLDSFSRVHHDWSVPIVFETPVDQYHPTSQLRIRSTPCQSIEFSENYMFVLFFRLWQNGWKYHDDFFRSEKFGLVDIYKLPSFAYTGSFYLSTIYLEEDNCLLPYQMDVIDDSILSILYFNPGEGTDFISRKIKVQINSFL